MILATISKVLYSQLFVTPPYPHFDCSGMTFIVTGANTGLGKEAAHHFVRSGAQRVIITSRSAAKGDAAVEEIEHLTQRKGVVENWPLDLENHDSIKSFADRVSKLDRVDALVENAGINTQNFRLAAGYESQIAVNVVGTVLLALLVIPHLRTMGKRHNITPTITIVSSEVHAFTSFPERKAALILENLNDESKARMLDRYNVSKLLSLLAVREVAKTHAGDELKVTVNLVNPGLCHSSLMREMDSAAVRIFQKIFARTTEVGSRTLVHGAMQGSQTHGLYLSDCRITKCDGFVRAKDCPRVQERFWKELASRLEAICPGVTQL